MPTTLHCHIGGRILGSVCQKAETVYFSVTWVSWKYKQGWGQKTSKANVQAKSVSLKLFYFPHNETLPCISFLWILVTTFYFFYYFCSYGNVCCWRNDRSTFSRRRCFCGSYYFSFPDKMREAWYSGLVLGVQNTLVSFCVNNSPQGWLLCAELSVLDFLPSTLCRTQR